MATHTSRQDASLEVRQSLLYAVGSICDGLGACKGALSIAVLSEVTAVRCAVQEQQQRTVTTRGRPRPPPTKETLVVLADVVYKEMEIMATELQHFAHHAGRRVIKPEDVLLLARKEPKLARALVKYQREHLPASAARKRRRAAPGAMDED